ncbi:CsgG/HfaB family protein [Hyalangium versicolor]|uniref:CsgG/HfaB family protein n=1 Tax=Hyalangium versicolor TaxID=2861190 RepID=UPI001CCDD9D8|nr:CsgG/HfaB family protein [Hyalangium versicolor]
MTESCFVPSFSSSPLRLLCLLLGLLALPASAAKPTVAVLYFGYGGKNLEMEVLKKGLAQMLISDLSDLGAAQLVERDRLQEILDELKLGQSSKFDQATVARIGQLVGARYLVMGDYFDTQMDKTSLLVMSARVVEVKTGTILRAHSARGNADEFLSLEQKLAQDIHKVLEGLAAQSPEPSKPPASEPSKTPGSSQPSRKARKLTAQTALRYSRALDAKDRKDVETAKQELSLVLKEQPDFVLASTDLALLMK